MSDEHTEELEPCPKCQDSLALTKWKDAEVSCGRCGLNAPLNVWQSRASVAAPQGDAEAERKIAVRFLVKQGYERCAQLEHGCDGWHEREPEKNQPPLGLTWGENHNREQGRVHVEWYAPCGCAFHPVPFPHVHPCSNEHKRPELHALTEETEAFTAYSQAIEDALAAIREESQGGGYWAATFINAIARKCSPHVYVNSLSPVAPSPTPEQTCKCGLPKDDPIHSYTTEWQQMHTFMPKVAPPSTQPPSARVAAEEIAVERLRTMRGDQVNAAAVAISEYLQAPLSTVGTIERLIARHCFPVGSGEKLHDEMERGAMIETIKELEIDRDELRQVARMALQQFEFTYGQRPRGWDAKFLMERLRTAVADSEGIGEFAATPATPTSDAARKAATELELQNWLLSDITQHERDQVAAIISRHFPSAQPVEEQKGVNVGARTLLICTKCGHPDDTDPNGFCQVQSGARNWAYCRCKCVFPAAATADNDGEDYGPLKLATMLSRPGNGEFAPTVSLLFETDEDAEAAFSLLTRLRGEGDQTIG